MVFSGNLWSCVKDVKPLVVFDKECCMALEPMQGIGPHLDLICGTRSSFMLLWLPQGPSRFVTVFLGTLCSSIKEDKAPLLFHGKHGIALFTMQGNWDSSRGEGKDIFFHQLRWEPGVYSRVTVGMALQNSCLFSYVKTPV